MQIDILKLAEILGAEPQAIGKPIRTSYAKEEQR